MNAALLSLAILAAAPEAAPSADEIRQSVEKSLVFLEKDGVEWIEKRKCNSCHQIPIMVWSHLEARRHNLQLNETGLVEWTNWSLSKAEADHDGIAQLILGVEPGSPEHTKLILGAGEKIIAAQKPNGAWVGGGQLPKQKRPPQETNQVSTLWMIAALDELRDRESDFATQAEPAIAKARAALKLEKPAVSQEWFVANLLVEDRLGEKAQAEELLKTILANQHEDGGWGWLIADSSDALATGMTLYALDQVGTPHTDPAIVRAQRFLLSTQQANGSWLVNGTKTNTKDKPQPTANAWGAGWAALGLLKTISR